MTLSLTSGAPLRSPAPSPVVLLRSGDIPHAERSVQRGELIRVHRGILAPREGWMSLKPWNRYLARVHAVALTHPGVVFCLESAVALIGSPIFGEPLDVHVLDDGFGTSRLSSGIRTHTTLGDREIVALGALSATAAGDTVIDVARNRHPAVALAVADAALRSDRELTVDALVASNEMRLSSRGRRIARWALHRASPLAETPLESVSRAAVEWLGFEQPTLQREFSTKGVIDRSDMWWPTQRVVGEADGDVKYDGSLQDPVAAIRREKDRDNRLRLHANAVQHWGWGDVGRVDPLRSLLLRCGLTQVAAEDSRQLEGLRRLLRS